MITLDDVRPRLGEHVVLVYSQDFTEMWSQLPPVIGVLLQIDLRGDSLYIKRGSGVLHCVLSYYGEIW